MASLHPYIYFNGNAAAAFAFYRSVFGTEVLQVKRYKDIAGNEIPVTDRDANRVLHIALSINSNCCLLGSDVMELMGRVNEKNHRNTIFINAGSREEADMLFNGLSQGGKVEMPMAVGPWGAYFGICADKYGVQWMMEFKQKSEHPSAGAAG